MNQRAAENFLTVNEASFQEITEKIESLLREGREGEETYTLWVEAVWEDSFVYRDGENYFRQSYKYEDEKVSLEGEPAAVSKEVEYVNNSIDERKISMDKKELIAKLVANEKVNWSEEDKEFLEAFDEEKLQKMLPVQNEEEEPEEEPKDEEPKEELKEEPKATEKAPVQEDAPVANTAEQYIESAPEGIRDMLKSGLDSYKAERSKIISSITANKACAFTANELEKKDLAELKKLQGLAVNSKADYSGNADAPDITHNANEEALPLPTMNFKK